MRSSLLIKLILLAFCVISSDMSVQILLAKDVLVRNVSICFDGDTLPVEYKTESGKVKERNAHIMQNSHLKGSIKSLISKSREYIDKKHNSAKIDRTVLDANYQTWLLLSELFSDRIIKEDFYIDKGMGTDISECERITSARTGTWVRFVDRQALRDRYSEVTPIYHRFTSLANHLEEVRDKGNKAVSNSLSEWKRNGEDGGCPYPDAFRKDKVIKIYQIGTLVVVKIIKKYDGHSNFIMTNVHLARVIDYLKGVANLSLFMPDIDGMEVGIKTLLKLIRYQINIGIKAPNGVGGVFKSARQILFLRGDTSCVLGSKPVNLYSSGISGYKEKYAEDTADFLDDITNDRKSALNLANIFKLVPHPDQDMSDVFETIEGSKSSNPVDDTRMDRFEGNTRKSIYESLTQQKIDIRAEPKDFNDDIASSFANLINSTSTPTSSVLAAGYTKWAAIRFIKCRGLFQEDKQDIPVSNKASAPEVNIKGSEIDNIDKITKMSDYKNLKKKLTAINDVVTRLDGKDDLDFKEGRKRFRNIVKLHEDFERNYLAKGISIDDIPSDDLSEFIRKEPESRYSVLTEPKLGEVHKELTRLFYMAEQALKVMTQVCERFTKKVIGKASGISITKSYRARRKELESMLHSHTGITFTENDDGEISVLFTSFDMSEFSKKFSQKIVRAIGQILTELSGEDWMSRIDVFFRASVVYHNTRGFVGVKSGIKGGFEGFLNFLWTLAMKVVMDIATQATGVNGVLAVYSDDGLLRLYINGDKIMIQNKIKTIQEVFKSYGLVFHLDKTVVSAEILEYLGVYGENGNIIPTWIKELSSVGKRKRSKGLETVYDRVSLWESQCSALVKANGPTYPSFLLKTILTVSTLRRLNRSAPSSSLCILTAIPFSAGGFRVPSISESSILSAIDNLSEFSADMELMNESYGNQVASVLSHILDNLKSKQEAEKTLVSGSLLQTTLSDTSGDSVTRKLLDSSSMIGSGSVDPFSDKIRKEILSELRRSENIRPKTVRSVIQDIPDVIEYNQSMAIMKSDAALKFVSKKNIRDAQFSDTKRCKNSITDWVNQIRLYEGSHKVVNSTSVTKHIIGKLYPDYNISFMIESPRVALIPVEEDPHILTTLEFTSRKKLLYQEYREPTAKFLGAQLSPEATAEASHNTRQRRYERFVASAARMVASNRSMLSVYYIIANSFGLPCPTIPSNTVISSHRSSRNFGSNAVTVFMPIPFHALINSRMSNRMWSELDNDNRADRTTMVESARMSTHLNTITRINNDSNQYRPIFPVLYNIRSIADNTANPEFISIVYPRRELIDTFATKSFITVIVEENSQANMAESTINTEEILDTIKDTPMSRAILTKSFERWLHSVLMSGTGSNSIPPSIPDVWKLNSYAESCVNVSYKLCAPNVRRAIKVAFSRFAEETTSMGVEESMEEVSAIQKLNQDMNKSNWAFDIFDENIKKVTTSLLLLDMDNRVAEQLNELDVSSRLCMKMLVTFVKRSSVTGGVSVPTIVINTDDFADSRLSRNVKNAIKEAVDSSLALYLSRGVEQVHWEDGRDTIVNFLYILKNMIRPSGHRGTPFNSHMLSIQMIKFELFIQNCFYNDVTELKTSDLEKYRIPYRTCRKIMSTNATIGGRSSNTSGDDMRTCLIHEGVPTWMIARANYILKRIGDKYRGNSISLDNINDDNMFMHKMLNYVLDTYNSVISESVSNLVIRHKREAESIGNSVLMTPVDEASLIIADINEGDFVAYEEDINATLSEKTNRDIITNLIIAHYSRWRTSGYNSIPEVNRIMKAHGIFGECTLDIRNYNSNPLVREETDADYTLSKSVYYNRDTLTHNYLYINRLPGGMAIMAKENEEERYILFSIIPKGVFTINTDSVSEPVYLEPSESIVPVYSVEKVWSDMFAMAAALNLRPDSVIKRGEIGSIVVQQSYQRLVGARTNTENEDMFLVAMAEVVRGAWSIDLSNRVLAMFIAWHTSDGEVSIADFKECDKAIKRVLSRNDADRRMAVAASASAVWTWIKLMNISAGEKINTNLVMKIVRTVGSKTVRGGSPAAYYNMPAKSLREVKGSRNTRSIEQILVFASGLVFMPPPVIDYMLIEAEDEYGDEW